MNFEKIILDILLDKYEQSKSLYQDSNRRIILKMSDFKQYNIENYEQKKLIHDAIFELNKEGLIEYSWVKFEKRKLNRSNMAKQRQYSKWICKSRKARY